MNKQLIIAGFHRSGTSMLAQELHNAGLFLGDRLMEANFSNADGHFEDMDLFQLHEQLLHDHGSDWQHCEMTPLAVSERYKKEMLRIAEYRNKHHNEWGFKEPRTVLFLSTWQTLLPQPHTLIIYRHYSETSRSLLQRAAGELLYNPNPAALRFWREETLSYRMWLAYNRRLIEHARTYPQTTLVVSHEAVIKGFPIVETVIDRFGFNLKRDVPSAIKSSLLSDNAVNVPLPDNELLRELEQCWGELQALSIVPAQSTVRQKEGSVSPIVGERFVLRQILPEYSKGENKNDVIANTLAFLQDGSVPIEERIRQLGPNIHLFFTIGYEQDLIEIVEKLLTILPLNETLWHLQGDLYRRSRQQSGVERSALMLLATAPKILPWHYAHLAEGYLEFGRLNDAKLFIDKAITGNPNNPQFYMIKASLFRKMFQYGEALSALETAIGKAVELPNMQLNAMLHRCDIFHILYDYQSLDDGVVRAKKHANSMEETPAWFESRISAYKNQAGDVKDVKALWKDQVSAFLEKENFTVLLDYMIQSIPDVRMQDDLVARLLKHVNHLRSKTIPKRCIIVLGMHRSGTSCLMGTLEQFGLAGGDISTFNPFNRKGNRENFGVVALNEVLLQYNNSSWDHPPERLTWNDDHRMQRDAVISALLDTEAPVVGFKDPRTVFTLPFWLEGLEPVAEVKLVGSFRHPDAVIASLRRRDPGMLASDALTLWKRYNSRLAEQLGTYAFPLVAFDNEENEYLRDVETAAAFLGLDEKPHTHFYDRELVANRAVQTEIEDTEAALLFKRLRCFSESQWLFGCQKRLTVIVNFYNMRREAERTLYTLSSSYQGVAPELYDVVAIDNGSTQPLDSADVTKFGPNFHYLYFQPEHPSPVEAINFCASAVKSEYIMCMIDGARMLSPGILSNTMKAWTLSDHPFVYTIGMHIGSNIQNVAMESGYNKEVEDRLIATVNWKTEGYRLFDISAFAASSEKGFFSKINESNCFSLKRQDFLRAGGFNPKFTSPGGGLVNLDFFNQIHALDSIQPILLLGEASFYQYHGGVATNVLLKDHPFSKMNEEYQGVYGKSYSSEWEEPYYFGRLKFDGQ